MTNRKYLEYLDVVIEFVKISRETLVEFLGDNYDHLNEPEIHISTSHLCKSLIVLSNYNNEYQEISRKACKYTIDFVGKNIKPANFETVKTELFNYFDDKYIHKFIITDEAVAYCCAIVENIGSLYLNTN